MRARIAAAAILLIALSSTAWGASDSPKLNISLQQLTSSGDIFYFRGPINIQYQLSIENPTDQPVTLKRLELSSLGPGSYSIHTGSTPITRTDGLSDLMASAIPPSQPPPPPPGLPPYP